MKQVPFAPASCLPPEKGSKTRCSTMNYRLPNCKTCCKFPVGMKEVCCKGYDKCCMHYWAECPLTPLQKYCFFEQAVPGLVNS